MRVVTLFLLILLATLVGKTPAAAFDCAGATLPSSIVICGDPDLTRLADERQQIYNEARSRLTPERQKALWEDQKAWVRSYAASCGVPPDNPAPNPVPPSVVECFKRAAESRVAYLRTYGLPAGAAPASPTEVASQSPLSSNVVEIPIRGEGGVFVIPIKINDVITLDFVVDSGAADVQIPVDVLSILFRAHAISDHDLIGEQTYTLADGSTKTEPRFLVHELNVGNIIVRNVAASVSPLVSQLLLGQSFFSRFGSWTVDNQRNVLRLVEKSAETQSAPLAASPAQAPLATAIAPVSPQIAPRSVQSALVCGRSVSYTLDQSGNSTGLLGVWAGNWNNADRLCAGLIVERINPNGTVEAIYVYGPSGAGSRLSWKQQHVEAVLSNGQVSFQDDQGSVFTFGIAQENRMAAMFVSRSGKLFGSFERIP